MAANAFSIAFANDLVSSLRALARADGTGDRGTNGEVKIYQNASS